MTLRGRSEVYGFLVGVWYMKAKLLKDRPKEFPLNRRTIGNNLSNLDIPSVAQVKEGGVIHCEADELDEWSDKILLCSKIKGGHS